MGPPTPLTISFPHRNGRGRLDFWVGFIWNWGKNRVRERSGKGAAESFLRWRLECFHSNSIFFSMRVRVQGGGLQRQSPPSFRESHPPSLRQTLSSARDSPGKLGWQALGIYLLLPLHLAICSHYAWPFTCVLGIKLGSLCP